MEIDPDLIVPNPELSIGDGAIEPWGDRAGRDQGWTANVAAAVSREFGIPLDKPWKNLTPAPARDHPVRRRARSA
jgi:excinuclease ABC subunit A